MSKIANLVNGEVRKEIQNGGFAGTYRVEETRDKPHISGGIELPSLDSIVIGYNPAYEKIRPGAVVTMARDVARHEQNHKRYNGLNGCPRNVDYHTDKFIEPIAKVLTAKGFGKTDVKYLSNTLEDSILHADLSSCFVLDGISEYFTDVGRNMPDQKFTPFYDAHVKLNMFLWGNNKEKEQQRPYSVREKEKQKKVAEVIQNFIRRTGIGDLEQEVEINGKTVKVKDKNQIRSFLNNEENWENISKIYAEEFSKLMEPSYAMPILNHSGKGTKGRESEQPLPSDGNEFDKEMEKEEYKSRRAQKAFSRDSGVPPLMESHEAMDLVYQVLARKLNLKVETFTESSQRPVSWYGERDFDPERDDEKHLRFGFDNKGEVVLKKRPHYVSIDIPHKQSPKGFPEARFCLLDTSGSMKLDPNNEKNIGKTSIIPWGDNSKYHYSLLTWYGLIEYLKQNHLLSQTDISLGNFSTKTEISHGLAEAKINALTPQWGKTEIDKDKIKDIFDGRGNLVYTVSDGDVTNWEKIREEFINNARNHCYFHVQIGPETEMTKDLKKNGFAVVPVRNAKDLAQKVIDVTDSIYRTGGLK